MKEQPGFIYSFIHSFIHSADLYSASSRDYYSEALPAQSRTKRRTSERCKIWKGGPPGFTLNSARTFRRPSFKRTQLGAANHSAYSNRRIQIQRLHISATFISANTTRRFQTQRLWKLSNYRL